MEATKLLKPLMKRVALGDPASMQAVAKVNAEQASKRITQELTRRHFGAVDYRGGTRTLDFQLDCWLRIRKDPLDARLAGAWLLHAVGVYRL